jgi:hypothetical protein
VATTAGGMSVTGSDGYGMSVDTTTGDVTFAGSANSTYIARRATTTTIMATPLRQVKLLPIN